MTDETFARMVANLLRAGVAISAVIVLGAGVCYVAAHGGQVADYRVFHPGPDRYRAIGSIFESATHGDCLALIQLGLVLLIVTPIARVAVSIAAFALERDRVYVAITSIVLAILLYSILHEV